MNKHTRLLVSALFAVIVILAVGITRFYMNVSNDTGVSGENEEIIRRLDSDEKGNQIYEDGNGKFGLINSSDKIIVTPEWEKLEFAGNSLCIASKRINGKILTGCIDYEGNITVPFIYKNITPYSSGDFMFYLAEAEPDGSCVVYDDSMNPCFKRSWDGYTISESNIVLQSGNSKFTYTCGETGLVCTYADIYGQVLGCGFRLNIYSRLLLAKLSSSVLEEVSKGVSGYLEFAFTGDRSSLSDISDMSSYESFIPIFPDDTKITSKKLLDIPVIFIYSDKNESGEPCYSVSVTANVEIEYVSDNGGIETLNGNYKAAVSFDLSSSGIEAVSGKFEKTSPDYPESAEETTAAENE